VVLGVTEAVWGLFGLHIIHMVESPTSRRLVADVHHKSCRVVSNANCSLGHRGMFLIDLLNNAVYDDAYLMTGDKLTLFSLLLPTLRGPLPAALCVVCELRSCHWRPAVYE